MAVMERSWAGRAAGDKTDDKKKKVVLVVASVLLLGVLAFSVPKTLKQLHGSGSTAAAPAATAAPVATSADPTAVGTTTTTGTKGTILDTVAPRRSPVLGRLPAKDPFKPLIRDDSGMSAPPAGGPAPATSAGAKAGSGSPTKAGSGPIGFSAQPGGPPVARPSVTAAVIWINDAPQVVGLSQPFPAGAPVFKLVSVSAKAVKIRVAGGRFADGRSTITIRRGHGVTLVNTTTGVRYDIRFAAPTAAPAAPANSKAK